MYVRMYACFIYLLLYQCYQVPIITSIKEGTHYHKRTWIDWSIFLQVWRRRTLCCVVVPCHILPLQQSSPPPLACAMGVGHAIWSFDLLISWFFYTKLSLSSSSTNNHSTRRWRKHERMHESWLLPATSSTRRSYQFVLVDDVMISMTYFCSGTMFHHHFYRLSLIIIELKFINFKNIQSHNHDYDHVDLFIFTGCRARLNDPRPSPALSCRQVHLPHWIRLAFCSGLHFHNSCRHYKSLNF